MKNRPSKPWRLQQLPEQQMTLVAKMDCGAMSESNEMSIRKRKIQCAAAGN